jgi:hypothetical protein
MPYAKTIVFWLALVAAPVGAAAEASAAAMKSAPGDVGGETRTWLELQRSGQAAAPERSVSGVVASRVYKRYLDSFDHPLPAFFEREAATSSTR